MNIDDRIAELNNAQTNALAEFYACTKALERADERVRSLNQQISSLKELRDEVNNDTAE